MNAPKWSERFEPRVRQRAFDAAAIAAAVVTLVALAYKVAAQISVGPAWDSFAFLANAAQFAGQWFGYTEPARPPLIALIVSLPRRLGYTHASVIQVADGLLAAVGLAAFYAVMRRRFSRVVSALGCLAFLVSPPVWRWLGVGYTDLAAVSFCLVALVIAIKATEDDPRWYLALPVTLLGATLMRTTSLLFVGVVAVWVALRSRPLRQVWHMLGGVAIAVIAYAPLGVYYARIVGSPLYPIVASSRIQQAAAASTLGGLERPVDSFVRLLPQFAAPGAASWLALALLLIAGTGLVVAASRWLFARGVRPKRLAGAVLVVLACAVAVLGRGPVSALVVAAATFGVWRLVATKEAPAEGGPVRVMSAACALDATMFAWLVGLLVFHEQWAQKVERYYIAMAPALIYLVALGLIAFVAHVREVGGFDGSLAGSITLGGRLVPVALVGLLVIAVALDVVGTSWAPDPAIADAEHVASWLRDGRLTDGATVYSDYWPQTAWYLKAPVKAMPTFSEQRAIGHELVKNDADFYVTMHGAGAAKGYVLGEDTGMTRILVADRQLAEAGPRVQYLGVGWENYAEKLAGFDFYLDHAEGDYNMEGSAFVDAYPLKTLEQHSAVAVYGAKWHDRSASERLLMEYVARGGTLVLDASANLTQPYSLQDCVLFDTVFTREIVPASAKVSLGEAFAARHPELEGFRNAAFSTPEDPEWVGVSYTALPGSEPLDVLASAEGRPIVAERHWGRGRVIFVGANLLWHAQSTGSSAEAALVHAIFEDAVSSRASASTAPTLRTSAEGM